MERVRQHIPNAQIFLALITGVSLSTLRQTHQSVPLLEFYILYNTPPAVANYPFVHYTLFPSFNLFPLPPPLPSVWAVPGFKPPGFRSALLYGHYSRTSGTHNSNYLPQGQT